MRFLAWHVDYVSAVPTEHGRSSLVEKSEPVRAENALLVFANFEKSDEQRKVNIVDRAAAEIISITAQLKVTSVVLNPFAHLFAEPLSPQAAVEMLDMLYSALSEQGLGVQKMAFGMFYELELKAKGHRLSRVARSIN